MIGSSFSIQAKNDNAQREQWIDAMKGIAILGVVLVHSKIHSILPSFAANIVSNGNKAVQIFFIISTYLACCSFAKNIKKENSTKHWWWGKVKRIIPLYFCALFVTIFWVKNFQISPMNFLTHVLLINGFSPYYINSIMGLEWYLADYFILIAIFPALFKYINSLVRSIALFVFSSIGCYLFSVLLMNVSVIPEQEVWDIYVYTFGIWAQLPVVALGMILFFLVKSNWFQKIYGNRLLSVSLLVAGGYGILILLLGVNYKGLAIHVVYAVFLFLIILSQSIYKCPILNNSLWRSLGRHSYFIYLFHYILFWIYDNLIEKSGNRPLLEGIIRVIVVFASAYLMANIWETIKKIYLVLKDKLKNRELNHLG